MPATRVFGRREIESLIADGDSIVIYRNTVLRLNGWRDEHPGGGLVIEHMVGRDAVDEINISHSPGIVQSMQRYRIGLIDGQWENLTPPIQRDGALRLAQHDKADQEQPRSQPHPSDRTATIDAKARAWTTRPHVVPVTEDVLLSPTSYTAEKLRHDVEFDTCKYPSLDAATQRNIAEKFQLLHQRVEAEGHYHCRFSEYGKEMLRYVALFATFAFFLSRGCYFVSACFLGLFWHQIMFTAHDAGHRAISQNFTVDTLIGIFIADLCCGLSIGWWKSSHNVHHLVPNLPEHDPDIQNVPLFATSASFFNSIKSSYYGSYFPWDAVASFAVPYQKFTYYPVMGLARFNLYILSWAHLLSSRSSTKGRTWWTRPTEIAAISVYIFLYFYTLLYRCIPFWQSRAIFLLVSHLITMPLHVQITLSHWGTSTTDLGPSESFAQRQLRTTMDVQCPQWLDWIHGGLQFQAIHHLFPRVPRHNLRRLGCLVREFCAETEIEYLIHGFAKGNKIVLSKLEEVAQQARILAACQAHMALTGESGLH